MAYIDSVDDCDGLKFQHGPKFGTGAEWSNSGSVIQVSNDHNLLFIASKTVEVHQCSKFLSSLLDDQNRYLNPIKHIDVEFEPKRLRLKGNLLAIQGDTSLVLYDFTKWEILKKWDHEIVDFQWLNDSLVCIDKESIYLYGLNDDEENVESTFQTVSQDLTDNVPDEEPTNEENMPSTDVVVEPLEFASDATIGNVLIESPQESTQEILSPDAPSVAQPTTKEAPHLATQPTKSEERVELPDGHTGETARDTDDILENILSAMSFGSEPSLTQKIFTDHSDLVTNVEQENPNVTASLTIQRMKDEFQRHQDNPFTHSLEHPTLVKQHSRSSLVRHMYSFDCQTSLDKLRTTTSHGNVECEVPHIAGDAQVFPKEDEMVRANKMSSASSSKMDGEHPTDGVSQKWRPEVAPENGDSSHTPREGSDDWLTEGDYDDDWSDSSVILPEAVQDPHHGLCPGFSLHSSPGGNIFTGTLTTSFPYITSPLYSGIATPLVANSGKTIRKISVKSEVISPEYEGYIASCISNPPSIARMNEDNFKNGINYLPITLPEDLDSLDSAIVVGCALLPDDFAAVSFVINSQDTLICIVKLEPQSVITLFYAYNELYLLDTIDVDHPSSRIESLWIPSWETLMVWSGNSTQVVMISRHEKLADSTWKVLMMQEGYCLESTDGEMGTRGLSFSVHFRETLYRKNACADTPLLVNPPAFLLAQKDGVISVHYADVWSRQGEVQVLDETMGFELRSDTSPNDIPSVVSIEDIHLYPHAGIHQPSSIHAGFESVISGATTTKHDHIDVSVASSVTIQTLVEDELELSNKDKIAKFYNDGVTRIWNLDEENETKLEAIKLFEAFSNTLDAFEDKLVNVCDGVEPSHVDLEENVNVLDNRILKWKNEVDALEKMQDGMIESMRTFECNLKPAESIELPLEHKMLLQSAKEIASVSTDCFVDFSDFSIKEAEDVIEGVYGSLLELEKKLDEYEKRVDDLELELIFKKVQGSRTTPRGSLLPLSSMPILQGDTRLSADARAKFEELLDNIEQISMRDVSISFDNLKVDKGHSPRFKRYQDLKNNGDRRLQPEAGMNGRPEGAQGLTMDGSSTAQKGALDEHREPIDTHSGRHYGQDGAVNAHHDTKQETTDIKTQPLPSFRLTLDILGNDGTTNAVEEFAMDEQEAMPTAMNTTSSGMDTDKSAFAGFSSDDMTNTTGMTNVGSGTSIFSSSIFNTTGSIFGTDRPTETQPSTFGNSMFSAPVTYTFGQQNDTLMGSNLGSSGTGTSIFSTFANNTSFADLAASKCTQPPTGSFTGMSGFTSGNFNPNSLNFSSVQGLLGTSNNTFGGSTGLGQNGTTNQAMSGDLWTRARQSNPLD